MKAALFPAIWLALGLAVALSVAGGCTLETTFGHGSSQAPASTALAKQRELIRRIELCRTREAELRQQFGEPRRDGRFQRSRILTWLPEGGKIERVFSVLLDRDGVVVDLFWDAPGVATWIPADLCHRGAPLAPRAPRGGEAFPASRPTR